MAIETVEQAPAESSVDERLTAFFSGEKPAKVEVAPAEVQAETQGGAAPETVESKHEEPAQVEGETASAEPFVDVLDDAGTAHKVPSQLKDSFLRLSDYKQKTTELAALRKSVDDRQQFAEAKDQILGAVMQDVVTLKETQAKLSHLQSLDWAALYNADPGQALNLRNQMDSLKSQVDQQQSKIQQTAAQLENARKQHSANQWQLAVEGVKAKIGNVSAADDAAMLQTVKELGFTQDELTSRFADPRFLQLVHMAAKQSTLQGQKPGALAALSKAPPVVVPGATKSGATAANKYAEARQKLKKSGDVKDAARLFLLGNKVK